MSGSATHCNTLQHTATDIVFSVSGSGFRVEDAGFQVLGLDLLPFCELLHRAGVGLVLKV